LIKILAGNIYIADADNRVIRKIDTTEIFLLGQETEIVVMIPVMYLEQILI
jgi:hypothetical protein